MGDLPSTSSSRPPPSPLSSSGTPPVQSGIAPLRADEPEAALGSAVRPSRPPFEIDVDVRSALRAPALPSGFEPDEAPGPRTSPPAAEPPSWRPHQRLPILARYGRFELLGKLARGGMAEILLARERSLGDGQRYVVVKRILPQSAEDQEYVKMFLSEGRLMMGLSHPNICHVYDVGREGETWFIAMEWVNGESLAKVVRRARARGLALPAPIVARTIADVAAALHHAHNAKDANGRPIGLVHRDVSPHNVMVAWDGTVKLLDFGIAKVRNSSEHTTTGVVKGKFAYMAPEQCLGRELDARADVFALGICLFEALTGRALFRRDNEYETLRAVIKEPAPSIRESDPRLPEALDHIVQRALQKRREDRFESALAMQLALEKYLADERHLVSSALVGRLLRRLFAEEIRRGPTLAAITVAADALPDRTADAPSVEQVEEPSRITASSGARRTGRLPSFLAFAAACALGAVGWLAWGTGVMRIDSAPVGGAEPEPVPAFAAPPAPAPEITPAPEVDPESTAAPEAEAEPEPIPARLAAGTAADSRSDPRERATATLSLNTRPWSKVYVRGRLLGTTPLGAIPVGAGRVRLRLEDRDGRVHHRVLRLRPGERAERFIDLSAETP